MDIHYIFILLIACIFQDFAPADSEAIKCVNNECNCSTVELDHPENGKVKTLNGTDALYYCNKGYMSVGDAKLTCVKVQGNVGEWSSANHSCDPIVCQSAPGNITNGNVTVSKDKNNATYLCDDGYSLEGNATIWCGKTGNNNTWQGDVPTCTWSGNDTENTNTTSDTTTTARTTTSSTTTTNTTTTTMSTTKTSTYIDIDTTRSAATSTNGTSGDFEENKAGAGFSSHAVYISIIVIIVVAAGIVLVIFFLRSRRHKEPIQSVIFKANRPDSPEASITNATYGDSAAHIRSSQSLDSGYAEIPIDHSKDNFDSEYQTIDSLPEDKTANSSAYGHLQGRKRQFENGNYSHIDKPQGNKINPKSTNMNYSHIDSKGQILNASVSSSNTDNTYNTLGSKTGLNENGNGTVDNEETEYDHAQAGRSEAKQKMKESDEYAHLGGTGKNLHVQKRTENQINPSMKDGHVHEIQTVGDTDRLITADSKNAVPPFSKVDKRKVASEYPSQTVNNYEFAVDFPHEYLILQPDTENTDGKNVQFHIVENEMNNTSEISEYEEQEDHKYFTLEKSAT